MKCAEPLRSLRLAAHSECYETPQLPSLCQLLELSGTAKKDLLRQAVIGFPDSIWNNKQTAIMFSRIYSRHSAALVPVGGNSTQAKLKLLSGNLEDECVLAQTRHFASGSTWCIAGLLSQSVTGQVSVEIDGQHQRKWPWLALTDANAIRSALTQALILSHSAGKRLVIINNKAREDLVREAHRHFCFGTVELDVIHSKPNKGWQKRAKAWSNDANTVLVATKMVSHAHLAAIECEFAGGAGWSHVEAAVRIALSKLAGTAN